MAFTNRGKILLVDHEAHALRSSAIAGALLEASQAMTVVVGVVF
jgi:hypothetical protein